MPWADYHKIKEIGSGSFGRAYLVSCKRSAEKDKKLLVMKEIDMQRMDSKERKNAEVEAHVLSSLKHPYIVKYSESFVHDQVLCILMDYCEGGDLWQYIAQRRRNRSTIGEPQVVRWFTQMCLALKHMHDKNVLHRDIKTQNVFIAKRESRSEGGNNLGSVKIADFGIAKVLDSHTALARTQVGTPYYLSPEICSKQPYAQPSDVWALGCVIYELAALRVPFEAAELPALINKILHGPISRIPSTYSRELADIVVELLSRQASQRPSAEKVLQKPMLQVEIKKMLEEGKKPGKDNIENNAEEHVRRGNDPARDHGAARQHQQRNALQDHNQNPEARDRDRRDPGKPRSRAPSPHREVAKQILRPSRAPSPAEQQGLHPQAAHQDHRRPHSARQGYDRHSHHRQPNSAR